MPSEEMSVVSYDLINEDAYANFEEKVEVAFNLVDMPINIVGK